MKDSKKKSILGICILYFSTFAVILLVFWLIVLQISDSIFQNAMPTVDDFTKYESQLENEDYSAIPIRKFKSCSFAVFNEKDELIYASSDEIKTYFLNNEIRFISDLYSNTYFSVFKKGDSYLIVKNGYDDEEGIDRIIDYCVVDSNLNITDGKLFSDRKSLTSEELELLSDGTLSGKNFFEKTSFKTADGKNRSFVLITPVGDQLFYSDAQKKSQSIWLVMIPVLILLVSIVTKLFVKKIKGTFKTIDEAVCSFEKSRKFDINPTEVPIELDSFVYNFSDLIDNLNYEKMKNEAAYREKQRVFANLSHDLRTPLTVIQGYAKAFVDGVVPKENVEKYMSAIYNRASDATNIIESLYEYSRLAHPDFQINLCTDDLCEFCKEYLAEKYYELELVDFKLDFSIPEVNVAFSYDKVLIKRLFDNIIGNSVKYNKAGTTIYFSMFERSDEILFILGDDGIGIPEEICKNAFKPFVIGDEARTNNTGTGLGLTIAKNIVALHQGNIEIVYPPDPPYKTQIKITLHK